MHRNGRNIAIRSSGQPSSLGEFSDSQIKEFKHLTTLAIQIGMFLFRLGHYNE